MNNANVQSILRMVVLAGGAVVAVSAAATIFSKPIGKHSIMPAITGLVGLAAFTYALNKEEIKLIPSA